MVLAVWTKVVAGNRSQILGILTRHMMTIGKPRPATWLANKLIAPPVTTGPMEDVFNVAHCELSDELPTAEVIERLVHNDQTCKQYHREILLRNTEVPDSVCLYGHNRMVVNIAPSSTCLCRGTGFEADIGCSGINAALPISIRAVVPSVQLSVSVELSAQVLLLLAWRGIWTSDGLARSCRDNIY